jgi:hypothetical protein
MLLHNSVLRHMNSVFRGPDDEGGADVVETDVNDAGNAGAGDDDAGGSDSGDQGSQDPQDPPEKLSVREEIKRAIADAAEGDKDPKEKKAKKDPKTGKFQPADGKPADPKAPVDPAAPVAPVTATAAPEDLSPEAKAEWAKTPPAVQAAFIKRGQEMQAGVDQLKQRYAQIDQAIQPHTDALRQMNATPGEAVNRMFLWFKALAGTPAQAFPALAKSLGIEWEKLVTPAGTQAAPALNPDGTPVAPAAGAPEIPEPVKQYVSGLEKQLQELGQYVQQIGGQFTGMQQTFQTQSEQKTKENLGIWATGKDYFEEVRQDMAQLIQSGIIPLKADGQVDLDTAYERAIYFNPDVRAKVLAKQTQANQQVQQEAQQAAQTAREAQVGKARKAAVSIPASQTPGAANGRDASGKKPGQKLSVRESLKASIAQLRDQ